MKRQTNKYYWTCPKCGSNNDPGERCDCGVFLSITNLSDEGEMNNGQTVEKQQQYVRVSGRCDAESGITKSGDLQSKAH